MSLFLETLSSVLKSHSITIYALAAASGIERSYLSKILSGKRGLSHENFSSIINAIPVSTEEDKLLRERFIAEIYGKEKFENYISIIQNISELTNIKSKNPGVVKLSLELDGDTVKFDSHKDFINIAEAVVDREVCETSENKRIYTNIDSEILLEVMKKYPMHPQLDFKQIIAIGNDSQSYAKIIAQTLNFAILRYPTNYYNNLSPSDQLDNLFPFYLVTSEFCVFADKKLKNGYIVKNKVIADIYADKFLFALKKTESYIDQIVDIMASKECHVNILKTRCEKAYNIETCLCPTFFMSLDIWEQIAKPDVPDREFLIDSTYKYYQHFLSSIDSHNTVLAKRGLLDFVRNGIVSQMPREYADPLTKENRLAILEKFKEHYQNDCNHLFLIKEGIFHINDSIDAEIFDKRNTENTMNMLLAIDSENNPMKFVGNFSFNISDKNTIIDFMDFVNCFIVSGMCYTEEESLAILDEEIQKLKYDIDNN